MRRLLALALIAAAVGTSAASPDTHGTPSPTAAPKAAPHKSEPAATKVAKPTPELKTGSGRGTPADSHDTHATAQGHHADTTADADAALAPSRPAESPREDREPKVVDADGALKLLTEGNQRWVRDEPRSPNITPDRREQVADSGQKPFVTILTCADSRLPVERLFDRGVGDVFVVRVAGNVAGASEVGTIEYGVGHLKTPLLVVMGHTKCGAVAAAASDAEVHGKVAELIARIDPAVERARKASPGATPEELTPLAIRENVWQTIFDLMKSSPELRSAARDGGLRVVGAVCDISSGKVEWLGEHPWQSELVAALDARAAQPASTTTAGADADHNAH